MTHGGLAESNPTRGVGDALVAQKSIKTAEQMVVDVGCIHDSDTILFTYSICESFPTA